MDSAETLTVVEAARRLGIGRGAAYRAARRGDLPVIRVGHRLLVLRRPLDRLLGLAEQTPELPGLRQAGA